MANLEMKCQVSGLRELSIALRGVDDKVRNKGIKKAARIAANIILKAARSMCPSSTEPLNPWKGLLKKSLGTKIKLYKNNGIVVAMIGPRDNFRKQVGIRTRGKHVGQAFFQDPRKIAHLVEFGTRTAKAQPFLRPAYDHHKSAAEAAFARVIKEELGLFGIL